MAEIVFGLNLISINSFIDNLVPSRQHMFCCNNPHLQTDKDKFFQESCLRVLSSALLLANVADIPGYKEFVHNKPNFF